MNGIQSPEKNAARTCNIKWTAAAVLASALFAGSLAGAADGQTPSSVPAASILDLKTQYASIRIDSNGFITSLTSLQSKKEYSPAGHPSPLMSLHVYGQPYTNLISPVSASFNSGASEITLKYPGDVTAVVKAAAKDKYFRFQLVSLTPRGDVDNIVWGPLHTTISRTIGDLIGVVRDSDWAIGMLGLDDNTITGPPVDGDCYQMGYYIHSPDPAKYPLPSKYKEGQQMGLGGPGGNYDWAYYSQPEEYFRYIAGTGASLDPEFGSTVAYHARNRRRTYTYLYSLLGGFRNNRARHQVTDPVDVDFASSAVALYACPDAMGLHVIESIILAEGLPHPMIDGKWIRDPAALKPDIFWTGPHGKLVEYADALGLKAVQDEGQGLIYANPADHWNGKRVGMPSGGLTYKEFTDETNAHGIRYGLHTLCLLLKPGTSIDVTPIPNEHLQTVLRTKLAKDIGPNDTDIEVTDPSWLGENGTWPAGDGSNILRIGKEFLAYAGVSATPPYMLTGVKRGNGSPAEAHKAGDEVVKLQHDVYGGYVPDMTLMPDYADYYAKVLAENGMEYIDFDGLESTVQMNQGYYGVRCFFRRLFDTYSKLTGGKVPRVMGSCVFAGGWEYMSICNVGGGNNMFDPVGNHWGIEGKDIRYAFASSYFPATFGIQNYSSDWTVYDAENLQAKSIGWDATYMLGLCEGTVEQSGEKEGIFKAYRTWENARAAQVFTPALKEQLKDLGYKFHLEQTGDKSFVLYPVKEVRVQQNAGDSKPVPIANTESAQPLQFALQVKAAVDDCDITLPDGSQIKTGRKLTPGQFIICKGDHAYVGDAFRRKIADIPMPAKTTLPAGESKFVVQFPAGTAPNAAFILTTWISGKGENVGS